jgi:hypothetical protein
MPSNVNFYRGYLKPPLFRARFIYVFLTYGIALNRTRNMVGLELRELARSAHEVFEMERQ